VTTIFTIGHGARSLDAFVDLVLGTPVRRIADVRTAPGSRRHPHFGRDALAVSLPERGITYEWWGEDLGGFRRARPESPHVELRSDGFRGYADHMDTDAFRAARSRLIDGSEGIFTAVMCAETVWWRCHRRMLADGLLAAGCEVIHILDGPRLDRHRLTTAARIDGDRVVYDVPEDEDGQRRLTT
jgi:uncharacterized protein (DUF488 family)